MEVVEAGAMGVLMLAVVFRLIRQELRTPPPKARQLEVSRG